MASLSRIVNIQVSLFTVAVKVKSFDGLMIADYFPTSVFPERVRVYEDPETAASELVNAPGALQAVDQAFAQSPQISAVYVGRRANNPLTKVELTPVAFNSRRYQVQITKADGSVSSPYYDSDASATVAEICTGLTSAINTAYGAALATDGTTKITCVAPVATDYFSLGVLNPYMLHAQQTQSISSGATADLDAILAENSDWYAFTQTSCGLEEGKLVLAWGQTNKRLAILATQDADSFSTSGSDTTSLMATNHTASRDYGVVCYHGLSAEHIGAAWLAAVLTSNPGSVTFKFKVLKNVTGDPLQPTELNNIDAKKGNYFVSYDGNSSITAEGWSGSGQFIDVVRDSDWFSSRLQTRIYAILVTNPKVLYTDKGINKIAGAMRAQVKEAQDAGMLNDDPSSVSYTVPKRASIDSNTRASRVLNGMGLSAELAGAVHKVTPLKVNIFA